MTKDKALQQWFQNAVHDWKIPVADGAAPDPVKTERLLPAYASASVPDNAVLPYLTYDAPLGNLDGGPVSVTVNLWFRTGSAAIPNAAADELSRAVGYGGTRIPCDGGAIWLLRGAPFSRTVRTEDAMLKLCYINLTANFLTVN